MKETININISGFNYSIDSDAYKILSTYLDKLEAYYGDNEETQDIINDIEQRISELLNDRLQGGNSVITEQIVNEVIEIIGKPEEIFEETQEDESTNKKTRKKYRKLYRDSDNVIISGVISGMAAYLNLPVLPLRLLVVLLTIFGVGSPILIYIVCAIIIPKAITTAEKLEQRGENVTARNIERKVKEGYQNVKDNFKKTSPRFQNGYRDLKDDIRKHSPNVSTNYNHIWDRTHGILMRLLKCFQYFIGGLFLFISLVSIVSIVTTGIVTGSIFSDAFTLGSGFFGTFSYILIILALAFVCLIPLLLLAFLSIKLLFTFKSRNSAIVVTAIALWIVGVSILATIAIRTNFRIDKYNMSYSITKTLEPKIDKKIKTLTIDKIPSNYSVKSVSIFDKHILYSKTNKKYERYGKTRVRFKLSKEDKIKIVVTKEAWEESEILAKEDVNEMDYKYELQDSTLHLGKYFKIKDSEDFGSKYITVTIYIPENTRIRLTENMLKARIISTSNFEDYWSNGERIWRMDANGELDDENYDSEF